MNELQRVPSPRQDFGHKRRAPIVTNAPKYTTFALVSRCLKVFNHRRHGQTQQCDIIPIVPCALSPTSLSSGHRDVHRMHSQTQVP